MAAYVYEGMFILDSNRYGKDPSGVSGKINALVEKMGGEILVSRMWAEQRLAYPIDGHRRGTYWLTYFRLESTKMEELNYACNISDDILRFLFIKQDPRLVDMLIAHAEGHEFAGDDDSDDTGSDDDEEVSSEDEEEAVEAAD
ncbi:30S ribosomal protein S6 [Blastopirellula marina]|uniref:Small ribosomal subunit protein bS6 n=1 Tax=Blastopirellula marina TaxID=124 RepID=A0A2S8F7B6_9BACT|nr:MULTISPECIES: 30S ribosomal protein S6 [Pirellulaceae]PQO28047.1 30S ribosomal protein S6 [Blastopirellula marina]RCS48472.1 30S ribosomal protein S6 [Bremerella cremea]